jgi:hypothetical protein
MYDYIAKRMTNMGESDVLYSVVALYLEWFLKGIKLLDEHLLGNFLKFIQADRLKTASLLKVDILGLHQDGKFSTKPNIWKHTLSSCIAS